MKLSEYKGEQALDILADIVEPAASIFADAEVRQIFESGQPKLKAVRTIIKRHKPQVMEILAALDGEDPATYNPGLFTLPLRLIEILNDPELASFFEQQSQIADGASSGSAMGATQGGGE